MTQSENEQDVSAICALRKCLDLDAGNTSALFCLATAYVNESMNNDACTVLSRWLAENPNYSQFLGPEIRPENNRVSSFLDKSVWFH